MNIRGSRCSARTDLREVSLSRETWGDTQRQAKARVYKTDYLLRCTRIRAARSPESERRVDGGDPRPFHMVLQPADGVRILGTFVPEVNQLGRDRGGRSSVSARSTGCGVDLRSRICELSSAARAGRIGEQPHLSLVCGLGWLGAVGWEGPSEHDGPEHGFRAGVSGIAS